MRIPTLVCTLLLLSLGLTLSARTEEPQLYTCGMHPQIIQDHPGNCPICGMKLTPLRTGAAAGGITIDPETIQRMNLKVGVVTRGPVTRDIRAVGNIAYDESSLRDITLKYDGWIEQLYVDTTASTVKAGQPLFRIYSPDLYNAELNYLVALKSDPQGTGTLARAARARLELFDLSADHIAQLAKAGQAERTYTYRAPADGIVIEKPVVVGRKVKAGELIYRLAKLNPVWAVAQFYDEDTPFVHTGAPVTIRTAFGSTQDHTGHIELLEPQLANNTRTLMARIVLANPDGNLRPGTYVDVNLATTIAEDAVLVPATAVLRTGRHNTVFIALPGGRFDPREITLGARTADDHYQVLTGLAVGEKIVTSGQFMLDSESQLREGIQKMLKARKAAAATPPVKPSTEPQNPADAAHAAALRPLALAAADGAAALGRDDLEAYRRAEQAINAALKAYLASLPPDTKSPLARFNPLQQTATLDAARKEFEPFSTKLVDVVRTNPATMTGMHAFECPMSPVLGTGRWLQRDADLRNPFYGSAMATCGDDLK